MYRTHGGEIEELFAGSDRIWRARRLTKSGDVYSSPVAYVTTLADKSAPVARIVYGDHSGHIMELSNPGTGEGYVTQLAGQGPVARIVYGTAGQTIREISSDGYSAWGGAALSTIAGVTLNNIVAPHPYTTNLPGQGQVARVLYVDHASGPANRPYVGELSVSGGGSWQANVKELSTNGGPWQLADPTVITAGPPLGGRNIPWDPRMGYTSDLPGQGPAARVVYNTINGEIHEMNLIG